MLKAFLYDLGDIFFEAHYWREWMFDYFKSSGKFKGSFFEFYNLYEEFLTDVYQDKKTYKQCYIEFLSFLNEENPDKFMNKSFEKKNYFEKTRKLFDGVEHTLQRIIEKNILNIIISDNEAGEKEIRQSIIGKFNINHLIHGIISSKQVGVIKPHPVIFSYALDQFNLDKETVYFVAHDFDEIVGAKNFGLKVIEFNNYLRIPTPADYKITSFSDLLQFI